MAKGTFFMMLLQGMDPVLTPEASDLACEALIAALYRSLCQTNVYSSALVDPDTAQRIGGCLVYGTLGAGEFEILQRWGLEQFGIITEMLPTGCRQHHYDYYN